MRRPAVCRAPPVSSRRRWPLGACPSSRWPRRRAGRCRRRRRRHNGARLSCSCSCLCVCVVRLPVAGRPQLASLQVDTRAKRLARQSSSAATLSGVAAFSCCCCCCLSCSVSTCSRDNEAGALVITSLLAAVPNNGGGGGGARLVSLRRLWRDRPGGECTQLAWRRTGAQARARVMRARLVPR
jgi:hypothetical protein